MCVCVREIIYIYIYFIDTFIIIDTSQSCQGVWPYRSMIRLYTGTAAQRVSAYRVPKEALASLLEALRAIGDALHDRAMP